MLLNHGPLHRAAPARLAGVSRTTVSTIVNELPARGPVGKTEGKPIADLDGRAGDLASVIPRAAVAAGMNHCFGLRAGSARS
ncbi:hypothetical protein G5C60_08860 [Streptomyces sp. HC44]|uniref:Uncharacterized protein n=1 Tax=Streptomyces scabichelini TaxID=2711217 RepID=A0A6G4V1K2_9ACTN|nr:hypothetical protein [Streptomyces scabichelini]NGO07763.1 hypothetical protein [Streptomyces scabichelini]